MALLRAFSLHALYVHTVSFHNIVASDRVVFSLRCVLVVPEFIVHVESHEVLEIHTSLSSDHDCRGYPLRDTSSRDLAKYRGHSFDRGFDADSSLGSER